MADRLHRRRWLAGIGRATCADQRTVPASGPVRSVRATAPGRGAGGGRVERFNGGTCAGRGGGSANRCGFGAVDLERWPALAGRFRGAGHRNVPGCAHAADRIQRLECGGARSLGCGGHGTTRSVFDGPDHRLGPDHGRCRGVVGTGGASRADRGVFPARPAAPCAATTTGLGRFSGRGSQHSYTATVGPRTASALPRCDRPGHRLASTTGHGASAYRPLVESGHRCTAPAIRAARAPLVGKPSPPLATLERRTGGAPAQGRAVAHPGGVVQRACAFPGR